MTSGSLCALEKFSTLEELGERAQLLMREARELEANALSPSQAEWAADILNRARVLEAIVQSAGPYLGA